MTTTVVSGANRGIGLELCRLAKKRGDDVIALCREPSQALSELGARIEPGIDVGDDDVVATLRERLEGTAVDILINNAGVLSREGLTDLESGAAWDRMRREFEINSLGPLRVTAGVLPSLGKGAKVAIVTSRMGSIADNSSGSSYGYRMSKAAVNAGGVSLAHDLRGRGIAIAIVHPGWVRTDMTSGSGNIDPTEAATGILARIDDLTPETTGTFWHQNGERLPW